MRLHFLQHVWFEDLAYIKVWAERGDVKISRTAFFSNEPLSSIESFDWLVVMGGPMGVYDEKEYPWLVDEKRFICEAIDNGKKVLGICLGAQLIAAAGGGKVYPNKDMEIGWFDVYKSENGKTSEFFSHLPDSFGAFHWHGDTFDLPTGSKRLAYSKACMNQAFELGQNVIGLQFHLESNVESIDKLIDNCGQQLNEQESVQTSSQMKERFKDVQLINELMNNLLEKFFKSEN
ncbi:MAG: type 1 glutamine amidotransferase [Planctomycetota bacterium]|jgi:GMP synthase-like glutamine amidotransferase